MRNPWLAVAVKAAITLSLIIWLLRRIDLAPLLARFGYLDIGLTVASIALMMGQLLLTGWRWLMVTRIIGSPLTHDAALRLTLIGQFFNQTLPSAIGGDAVRAWLVNREGTPLGMAISGVFVDRIVALLLLVAIVGVTLPYFYVRIPDMGLRVTMIALVGTTAAGVLALLMLEPLLAILLRRYHWTRALAQFAGDLRRVLTSFSSQGILVAASAAAVHVGVVVSAWLVARALAINVSLTDCLILVPPIVLITTLPISIAGWGVRESATVVGFGFVGVAPADALALSVVFGLVQIAIGLPGGLIWMVQRRRPATIKTAQKSMQRPPRSQSP